MKSHSACATVQEQEEAAVNALLQLGQPIGQGYSLDSLANTRCKLLNKIALIVIKSVSEKYDVTGDKQFTWTYFQVWRSSELRIVTGSNL